MIQIEAVNRGPDAAELHLLPTLWFRNTWSWSAERNGLGCAEGSRSKASFPSSFTMHITASAGSTVKGTPSCFLPKTKPTIADSTAQTMPHAT